jgi:hypothetical protein
LALVEVGARLEPRVLLAELHILEPPLLIFFLLLVVDVERLEQLEPTQQAAAVVEVLAVLGLMDPMVLAKAEFHPLYIGAAHLTQII